MTGSDERTPGGRERGVAAGAAFLMATSAIGPGFLTQTAVFTVPARSRLRVRDPGLGGARARGPGGRLARARRLRPPRAGARLGARAGARARARGARARSAASSSTSATWPAAAWGSPSTACPRRSARRSRRPWSPCCSPRRAPGAGMDQLGARPGRADDPADRRGGRGLAARHCGRSPRGGLARARFLAADRHAARRDRRRLHPVLGRAPAARRRRERPVRHPAHHSERRARHRRRGRDARAVLRRRAGSRRPRRHARSGEPAGERLPARGGGVGLPLLRARALVGRDHVGRGLHLHVAVVPREPVAVGSRGGGRSRSALSSRSRSASSWWWGSRCGC